MRRFPRAAGLGTLGGVFALERLNRLNRDPAMPAWC